MHEPSSTRVPPHVPGHLLADLDFFGVTAADSDVHRAWKRIQDSHPDVFYTPRNGGHWIVARAAEMERVIVDHETFPSTRSSIPPTEDVLGFSVLPINADPPEHTCYRGFINPSFQPKALQAPVARARAIARELLADLRPRGRCEFVRDFAQHLPPAVFLEMVDLPQADLPRLIPLGEVPREPDHARRAAIYGELVDYLKFHIARRKAAPGADLISRVIQGRVGERPMNDTEILGECVTVLLGGLDTVASMMGFIARFLATDPHRRRLLARDPALIPRVVPELMRRHSVGQSTRRAARDLEIGGAAMRAGDRIWCPTWLHGLDERRWPNPLEVDFDRDATYHGAFARGVHRCPGAPLAMNEITVFLQEWLACIPEFEIEPGATPEAASGQVLSMVRLPLAW
ncbi:MAG: cytochrome P450 [Gammaproteobacteria bacterium]